MAGSDVMPLPEDTHAGASVLSEGLRAIGAAIANTQVASHHGKEVPGWIGQAADAYTDSVLRLGEHARALADSFTPASSAIADWADALSVAISSTVPALWERYDEASAVYERALASLDAEMNTRSGTDDPMQHYEYDQRLGRAAGERDSAYDDALRDYRTAMSELDAQAGRAATALSAALESIIDTSHASSRTEIAAHLFDDIPLVDGQAEWEHAQTIAPKIAHFMNMNTVTPEQLEEFYEKYAGLLANPFVANALSEHVSAGRLVEFSTFVGTDLALAPKTREGLLLSLGAVTVLATGGINTSDPQAAAAFEAARGGLITTGGVSLGRHTLEYIDDLKAAGRATYNAWEINDRSAYNKEVSGYEVIFQLMGMAGVMNPNLALGPAFFDTPPSGVSLAQDLVLWDSQTLTWKGLHGYMDSPHVFSGEAGDMVCDPLHSMYTLMDRPENLDLSCADPALIAGDRLRLDAVRGFLDSDTPDGMDINHDGEITGDDKPKNMTRYLTGGRVASLDTAMNEYYGFQDGGEQFGRVLDQATTPEPYPDGGFASKAELRHWQERDAKITNIAANFMFGYQDALEEDHDYALFSDSDKIDGQDVYGYHNQNLRSWAGLILADHIEGIAWTLNDHGLYDGYVQTDIDTHHITFDDVMRQKLLGKNGFFTDLGFDAPEVNDNGTPEDPSDDYYTKGRAPALDNLTLAAQHSYAAEMGAAVAKTDPTLDVRTVTDRWAPIMEALFTAPEDATSQALEALNARNERWQNLIKLGIGALPAGNLVSSGLEGASQGLVGYFADQARDGATTHLLDTYLPTHNTNAADHVTAETMVKDYMKESLYSAISTDGDLTTATVSPAERSAGLRPKFGFTDANGDILPYHDMTPKQRSAFRDYVSDMGPSTEYEQAFNQIDTSVNDARIDHGDARVITGGKR